MLERTCVCVCACVVMRGCVVCLSVCACACIAVYCCVLLCSPEVVAFLVFVVLLMSGSECVCMFRML